MPCAAASAACPPARRRVLNIAYIVVGVFILFVLPQILGLFLSEVLTIIGLYIMLGLGLNIIVGFAGMLDLGYVAFFAIGSYTVAILTSPELRLLQPELLAGAAVRHRLRGDHRGADLARRCSRCAATTWPSPPWASARSSASWCCRTCCGPGWAAPRASARSPRPRSFGFEFGDPADSSTI